MNVDLDNITVALSGEYVLIRERGRTVIFWHPWEGEAQFFNHGERPRPDKRSPELPEPPKGSYILLALAVFAGAVALALVFELPLKSTVTGTHFSMRYSPEFKGSLSLSQILGINLLPLISCALQMEIALVLGR